VLIGGALVAAAGARPTLAIAGAAIALIAAVSRAATSRQPVGNAGLAASPT
jgi:hypothetical protein